MTIELRRIRVCAAEEIPSGEGRVIRIGDRPVAVFHNGDTFHALDNTCTHMGGPLADGLLADDTIACPLHERRFKLATGAAVGHDCGAVAAYPVELADGDVFLTVPVMRGAPGAAPALGTFADAEVSSDGEPTADEGEVEREVEENAELVPDPGHRE